MTFFKRPKTQKAVIRQRIQLAAIVMVILGFAALVTKLFQLQIIESEDFQRQASSQQIRTTSISATRGTILDRNGNALAMSSTAWTVCISPNDIPNDVQRELIASGLSEILGVKADYIREKASRKSYYETIKAKVDKDVAEKVTSFATNNGINAIFLEEKVSRKYPYDSFASSVIGFVNSDNVGSYGLEAYYNDELSGIDGKVVSTKNAWGRNMPFEYNELFSVQDGETVTTTLDEGIQYYVEKHLELAVREHGVANRACCIAMNPKTCEIYAMATKGDFDPNHYLEIDPELKEAIESLPEEEQAEALQTAQFAQWRNKAISDPYEPGSVFKIITLSAALDSNAITVNDQYYCQGYIEVGDKKIACWKKYGHGQQTLAEAIENSCNPAFITIGLRMGKNIFNNYFEAFGLNEKTGIDLPGEATSIFHNVKRMNEVNLASTSFGQTFKITPIQLITAVSAAINGGTLNKPYLVSKIADSDGDVVYEREPEAVRQVISEATSETVRGLLETVTTEGSGKSARVPGYRIGGKTGTSEKLDDLGPDGTVDKYVLSFLGFAPADDPEIVILLLMDNPATDNPFGSVIAAPVVGAMLSDILPYMGIEPSYTASELEAMTGKVKDVTGEIVHDALYTLRTLGYSVTIVGDGTTVEGQLPEGGSRIDPGANITLYTEKRLIPTEVTVPDVKGKTVSEVNTAVIGAGLKLKLVGVAPNSTGQVAYSQSPAAGTKAYPDTVVEVSFTVPEQ